MRKIADCRAFPSESRCSLTISGEEEEVVRAAAEHAASVHGHTDTPELREQVRAVLTDESSRYGTVMIGKRRAAPDEMRDAAVAWAQERQVPGFLREELLTCDDGKTVVAAVTFASKEDYARLAEDPEQSRWWSTVFAPMLNGEPTWLDGTWMEPVERPTAVQDGSADTEVPAQATGSRTVRT